MSILKEINESHISLQATALTLFLVPFWYVSIYLFAKDFYKSSDTIVILAMCIVISLTSSVLFFLFCDKQSGLENTEKPLISNMILSVILLSFWITLLIFITYSLHFFFNRQLYFYSFVIIYYLPILFLNFLSMVCGADDKLQNTKE